MSDQNEMIRDTIRQDAATTEIDANMSLKNVKTVMVMERAAPKDTLKNEEDYQAVLNIGSMKDVPMSVRGKTTLQSKFK